MSDGDVLTGSEDIKVSEWDRHQFTTYRFEYLQMKCEQYIENKNLDGWYNCIVALKLRAYNVFTDEEKKKMQELFQIVTAYYQDYQSAIGQNKQSTGHKLYSGLEQLQIEIVRVFNIHIPPMKEKVKFDVSQW